MAPPDRDARRRLATRVVVALIAVAWVVRLAAAGGTGTAAGSAVELGVLALLLAWSLGTWLPVREITSAIGPLRIGLLCCLVVGVLAGQHLRSQNLYPFKRWDMYTAPAETSGYLELRMAARGEDQGLLPLTEVVPTASTRAYLAALSPFVGRAVAGDPSALDVVTRAVQAAVGELGRGDIDEVTARQCVVDGPTSEEPARCTDLLTIPVGRAGESGP